MINLVYICVFHIPKYLEMCRLLLDSIYLFGKIDKTADILIYTSTAFKSLLEKEYNKHNIYFEVNDNIDTMEKACKARLDLFDIKIIDKYKKVLYLDTDIIIKGSLNLIFNIIKTDVLYALKEGFINEDDDAHGKSLFGDELQNYEDKSAFTSGILLFNNCPSIKQLFYDIKKDMEIRTHFFYDQPFIIYNAFKYNLYNNIIIGLYCINNNNNIDSDKIIHHFPSGPGCCDDKLATMVKFLNNLKSKHSNKIDEKYLCLVAIFKNEAHILKEWLEHYLNQGVDRFFLIDNGSTDGYKKILEPYIKKRKVYLSIDKVKHKQESLYNIYYLDKSKQYEWVIVCDLDEFIYSRKDFRTIKSYLKSIDNSCSQVFIPWKIFGSNGFDSLDKRQPDNVIHSFTKRMNYNKEEGFQGIIKEGGEKYCLTKCIVRTKYLHNFNIHSHVVSNNNFIVPCNVISKIHPNNKCVEINEEILENSYLHLNHYAIQSLEWFINVKSTRGAADHITNDFCRNEEYFRRFANSSNDIDDFELLNI
jgi:hypothetical protein